MSDSSSNEVRYKCLDFLGFPYYWIGDDGSLWREWPRGWKRLKECYEPNYGYQVQVLSHKGHAKCFRVHLLVLAAFVGPRPEGLECRHLDGNPANNRLDNLKYGTKLENHRDRKDHGTLPLGEKNPGCKITEDVVREIRRRYAEGETERSIRESLGLSKAQVNKIVNRKSWTHVD